MTVNCLFFGHFKDIASDGLTIDLPEGTTVADLVDILGMQNNRFVGLDSCRAAANVEFVDKQYVLQGGDEIAFLPPMSGG